MCGLILLLYHLLLTEQSDKPKYLCSQPLLHNANAGKLATSETVGGTCETEHTTHQGKDGATSVGERHAGSF
jgi:hypothetical protein